MTTKNLFRCLSISAMLLAGCGVANEDAVTQGADSAASPLVGVWYSVPPSTTEPQCCNPIRARAVVSVDGAGGYSMQISRVETPTEPLHVLTGSLDPDGRHLDDAVTIDGQPGHVYGFATIDGARMFIGVRDTNDVYNASETWVFLRTE